MPHARLEGLLIAILATDGVEEEELTRPRKALDDAGATTVLVAPKETIKAWNHTQWGEEMKRDEDLDESDPDSFDGLLLPGGVMNADKLRAQSKAVEFVKQFVESGKPVAAICHAIWLLIEAGTVRGRTVTSWPSLQTDVRNAGGAWVDREVQTDDGIITSRKLDDIPAFNEKMIEEFQEGVHERTPAEPARAGG